MELDKHHELTELNTMKYKNIINNNTRSDITNANNLSNLETFLENEKNNNINEPWSRLDKTIKTKKILLFAEQYKKDKNIDESEYIILIKFLKDCLDRKKLQRVKDVIYDKNTGLIKDIPGLFYNKVKNHFTIKNVDKRVSTLKTAIPKKTTLTGTVKNVSSSDSDEEQQI